MYYILMSAWAIAQANLTSVSVLAFIFGFIASRTKSNLKLPDSIYQFISIYLLFGIGLKGGHSLKSVGFTEILTPGLVTIACGVLIPALAFYLLRLIRTLSDIDRGSLAAHYGSTSLKVVPHFTSGCETDELARKIPTINPGISSKVNNAGA